MKLLVALGLLGLLTGCSINDGVATAAGEKVRVTSNPQATAGCEFVGNVTGNRMNIIRNDTAALGGNVFWYPEHGTGGVVLRGEAYKCVTPAVAPEAK